MDRSIPHIRNIFSGNARKKSTSDTQDLCQDSSRSPRKKGSSNPTKSKALLDLGNKMADEQQQQHRKGNNSGNAPKTAKALLDLENKMADEQQQPIRKGNRNGNYNTYTSKTLTEKDMKHLERHLSMKKTIRKQISRNLAQAFLLDGPGIFEREVEKSRTTADNSLATEQVPVLDLLKTTVDDRDSGHSSPTPEHQVESSDYDEDEDEELEVRHRWSSSSRHHRGSDTKGLVEAKTSPREQEKKSSSIWKMFSPRRGRR